MIGEIAPELMDYISTLENDISVLQAIAEGKYPLHWPIDAIRWTHHVCGQYRYEPPEPDNWTPHGTIKAFIRHSRWLVMCPSGCGMALPASRRSSLFWCPKCRMKFNDGHALIVVFPLLKTSLEIETLLLMRPKISTRNWAYPETVQNLAIENQQHRNELTINKQILSAIGSLV